jgi:hypothetical protein
MKRLIKIISIFLYTQSLQGVITDITVFEKDGTKVVFLSDYHVYHPEAEKQAQHLKKLAASDSKIPMIVEDNTIFDGDEVPLNIDRKKFRNEVAQYKKNKLLSKKINSKLINFVNECDCENVKSIDSHRLIFYQYAYQKEKVLSILKLHKEKIEKMNSLLCQRYKESQDALTTQEIFDEFIKGKDVPYTSLVERLGEFFLELKILDGIEKSLNRKDSLAIVWVGDDHMKNVKKTLIDFDFNLIEKCPKFDNVEKFCAYSESNEANTGDCNYSKIKVPNIKVFFDFFNPESTPKTTQSSLYKKVAVPKKPDLSKAIQNCLFTPIDEIRDNLWLREKQC